MHFYIAARGNRPVAEIEGLRPFDMDLHNLGLVEVTRVEFKRGSVNIGGLRRDTERWFWQVNQPIDLLPAWLQRLGRMSIALAEDALQYAVPDEDDEEYEDDDGAGF